MYSTYKSNQHLAAKCTYMRTGWEEETASVYIAELLNRFIGNRVSNVAISPAWPWTRKLNDQSINSLIPAVRTPVTARRTFLTAVLSVHLYSSRRRAHIAASETITREATMQEHSPKVDRPQFLLERDKERKLELIPRRKKPLDIFIILPRRFYASRVQEKLWWREIRRDTVSHGFARWISLSA